MATKKRKGEKATKQPDPLNQASGYIQFGPFISSLSSRPSVVEHDLERKEFVGFVALGVDDQGECHVACDEDSAELALGELQGAFHNDPDGASCILPSSIRVLRIGEPGEEKKVPEATP